MSEVHLYALENGVVKEYDGWLDTWERGRSVFVVGQNHFSDRIVSDTEGVLFNRTVWFKEASKEHKLKAIKLFTDFTIKQLKKRKKEYLRHKGIYEKLREQKQCLIRMEEWGES